VLRILKKKYFGTDLTTNILKKLFLLAFVQRNLFFFKNVTICAAKIF